jgi:hypothetical protein
VWIELAREKHGRGLEDLVGSSQLRNLFAQRFDLLALCARVSRPVEKWATFAG